MLYIHTCYKYISRLKAQFLQTAIQIKRLLLETLFVARYINTLNGVTKSPIPRLKTMVPTPRVDLTLKSAVYC